MFLEIPDVLDQTQIRRLRDIARSATFQDGRISNPHNKAKKNEQIDHSDSGYQESSQLLAEAMLKSEALQSFTFMKRLAPPLMCRYHSDMSYGVHSDNAFIQLGKTAIRSDISSTIFLSDPDTYGGGDLTIHLGSERIPIKCAAGSAIVYPSTTLHEVSPVTSGERLVAITFIESRIADEQQRHLLYTLNEVAALEGNNISWDNRVLLEQVRQSLTRMWSD